MQKRVYFQVSILFSLRIDDANDKKQNNKHKNQIFLTFE